MKKKSSARRKKSKRILLVEEVGAVRQELKDHKEEVSERLQQGEDTMSTLATKSDLSVVMLDQASKKDMIGLTNSLFDEHGNPLFATKEDMQPLINLYKGSTFVKSFTAGLAAFVITLVAVGYALITLIGWLRGTIH